MQPQVEFLRLESIFFSLTVEELSEKDECIEMRQSSFSLTAERVSEKEKGIEAQQQKFFAARTLSEKQKYRSEATEVFHLRARH